MKKNLILVGIFLSLNSYAENRPLSTKCLENDHSNECLAARHAVNLSEYVKTNLECSPTHEQILVRNTPEEECRSNFIYRPTGEYWWPKCTGDQFICIVEPGQSPRFEARNRPIVRQMCPQLFGRPNPAPPRRDPIPGLIIETERRLCADYCRRPEGLDRPRNCDCANIFY